MYCHDYFPQPSTPYIELYGTIADPRTWAAIGRAPYAALPPEDIASLAADPALRSRYCELAAAVLLPPLRRMSEILGTKRHLDEIIAPPRLDPLLPGVGRGWTSYIGTTGNVFCEMRNYAAQFESLVGRWEGERCDLLQPDAPSPHYVMLFLMLEQLKDVGKK
jgi:hypothetical protein